MAERPDQVGGGDPAFAQLNETALVRGIVVVGERPGGLPRELWKSPLVVELVGPRWVAGFAAADGPVLVAACPEHITAVADLVDAMKQNVPGVLDSDEGRRLVVMRVRVYGRGLRGGVGDEVTGGRRWRVSPCDKKGEYYDGVPGKDHLAFSVEVPEAWLVERDNAGEGAKRVAIEAGLWLLDREEPVGPAMERG